MPIDVETIAVGILERLWHSTVTDAFRGDIGKLANDEIAESLGWFGDADLIVSILLESNWLDEHDECRLVVHDWADHAPKWVRGNAAQYGGFVVPTGGSLEEVPLGSSSMDAPPNLTKQSITNSNQTKPSKTKPSQPVPGGGDAGERADLDFLRLGENQYRDVLRQSVALNNAFGTKIDSSELVWKLAWVGYACSEGVIPGCIEKFKKLKNTKDAVKSPQAWLIGCINRELKNASITFDEAVAFVIPYSDIKANGY